MNVKFDTMKLSLEEIHFILFWILKEKKELISLKKFLDSDYYIIGDEKSELIKFKDFIKLEEVSKYLISVKEKMPPLEDVKFKISKKVITFSNMNRPVYSTFYSKSKKWVQKDANATLGNTVFNTHAKFPTIPQYWCDVEGIEDLIFQEK